MSDSMKGAFAEFIALLLFVYIGAGSVVAIMGLTGGEMTAAALVGIAAAHGIAIFVLAAAIGHISGGHINPAVTVAMLFTGKIGFGKAITYIIAQLLGAVVGAFLLKYSMADYVSLGMGAHGVSDRAVVMGGFPVGALIIEIIMTFALVFVIFGAAVDKLGANMIAPIAIGFTVFADHLVAVPFTGASMNPARTFGPAMIDSIEKGALALNWIYVAGPVAGAVLAGWIYMGFFKNAWED